MTIRKLIHSICKSAVHTEHDLGDLWALTMPLAVKNQPGLESMRSWKSVVDRAQLSTLLIATTVADQTYENKAQQGLGYAIEVVRDL